MVLLLRLSCCELLNATVCLYVSSFTRRCLELILGAFNWRAVVRSLRCVCVYTISTLYTNLVYCETACVVISGWNTHAPARAHTHARAHAHTFYWFNHFFKFESFIYEPYLPRPKYLRNPPPPDEGLLRPKHVEGDKTSFCSTTLVYGVDDDVFYIMCFTLCV